MARIKAKSSKASLDGLGLKPEEDERLLEFINKHDISIAQLKRALIRQCLDSDGINLLKYSRK